MEVNRSIPIIIEYDNSLDKTVDAYMTVLGKLSPLGYNNGSPLPKLPLHYKAYHACKNIVSAQMTENAIGHVAGAYASVKKRHPAKKPFVFKSRVADYLIGKRGRDASFPDDGSISIWTVDGRKRYKFSIPNAFKSIFDNCIEKDSLTVFERNGKLHATLCITIEVPEQVGFLPVGIDLNETNAIVAADSDDRVFFESGKTYKVRNKRSFKTRKRLQSKFANKKAQKKDSRSLRRLLKRLSNKRLNCTKNFCRQTAKEFIDWVKPNSVLVFENLKSLSKKKMGFNKSLNRRKAFWPRSQLRQCIKNKAELRGIPITNINPAYTSQTCSKCGHLGERKRHAFTCVCGNVSHADVNAAINIRAKYAEVVKTKSSR